MEQWKPIEGHEGYDVSNYGRIRSWRKKAPYLLSEPRIRRLVVSRQGYYLIGIGSRNLLVHRIVAKAFIPNPEGYKIINHKDGWKSNNYYENLEWCTSYHNNWHAKLKGLARVSVGMERKKSCLTDDDVRDIFKKQESAKVLAARFNLNSSTIYSIWEGRLWNHITGLPCTRKKRETHPF